MVRVADTDDDGTILNQYGTPQRLSAGEPAVPWAMHLAGPDGYRYLAFDLDAKRATAEEVEADLATLRSHLDAVQIAHVTCASGSPGGRHVWVALAQATAPELVRALRDAAALELSTLDHGMLANPSHGCCRPPGSPHRNGGISEIIAGDVASLHTPTTTEAQLRALIERMGCDAIATVGSSRAPGPLPVDAHGALYLPGPKRALPAASANALYSPMPADADPSAVQWTVLLGAASARWRLTDLIALVETAPGLEHSRSRPCGHGRRRRRPDVGPRSSELILRADWTRAIARVATAPRRTGEDPTFEARAAEVTTFVEALQTCADASAARWSHGRGPSQRRVLDVLCTLALEALTTELEADVRRIALLAGIGRETARTALLSLAEDGWISRTREAAGVNGARWTLNVTKNQPAGAKSQRTDPERSQAGTPRPHAVTHAGSKARALLLKTLQHRATAQAHDTFTRAALGIHTGNLYARLRESSPHAAADPSDRAALKKLHAYGLVTSDRHGWRAESLERREHAAATLGVAGLLEMRASRYAVERHVWAWWSSEHERLTTPGRNRAGAPHQGIFQLPGADTLRSWQRWPAFPRRRNGSPDHAAARHAIATGTVTPAPTCIQTAQGTHAAA